MERKRKLTKPDEHPGLDKKIRVGVSGGRWN